MTLLSSLRLSNVAVSDEEIAEDVLPLEADELAIPVELKTLYPWHRSRKQFVRENQWVALSGRLIAKVRNTPALPVQLDGKVEVKYLTLPGLDYLDVEMIAEQVKAQDCSLTSIGFLEGAAGNPASARSEMRQQSLIQSGTITDRSHTFARRIQDITVKTSTAYRELEAKGPFHVINLDACGSIALPDVAVGGRLIDVVRTLLEYQFSKYRGRWLFFVTTDVRMENFDANTKTVLNQAIIDNADNSISFANRSLEFLGGIDVTVNDALAKFEASTGDNYMKSFAVGFGKWLLSLSRAAGWGMKMHSSFCYSTTAANDDRASMPCLAFEFIPNAIVLADNQGAGEAHQVNANDYEEKSLRVLAKVQEMTNLDDRLANNDELKQLLKGNLQARLLKLGYSAEVLTDLD
jgi:hypothetical protein